MKRGISYTCVVEKWVTRDSVFNISQGLAESTNASMGGRGERSVSAKLDRIRIAFSSARRADQSLLTAPL
jgi:hypothetical protein